MMTELLLTWYDEHKRTLPWRRSGAPWQTWVSEIMLQQTRVETVLRYFPRFMEAFPDPAALAHADVADVLKLWEGLGYYSRARNLYNGAQQITAQYGGIIPATAGELRKICGIGEYTAGAIASIAFGEVVPAIDGNALRVFSRVCGIRENVMIPSVRRQLTAKAAVLVSTERPGDFNQAIMDLGSSICTPGTPDCHRCPLSDCCDACAAGDADRLPVLPVKKPPVEESYTVALIRTPDGRYIMRRRTESLLNGLWVFPMLEQDGGSVKEAIQLETGLTATRITDHGDADHVFTHRVWHMHLITCDTDSTKPSTPYTALTPEEIHAKAVPSAMRAAIQLLASNE